MRSFDIAVVVAGREVVLTGMVDDNARRASAEQIAADETRFSLVETPLFRSGQAEDLLHLHVALFRCVILWRNMGPFTMSAEYTAKAP